LRPFITDKDTQNIFGQELYEHKELLPLYKKLLGIEGIKPFECVGTNEEVVYAMYLQYENIKNTPQIPQIMEFFKNEILPTLSPDILSDLKKKLFSLYPQETHIPPLFQPILPI
jgi:UDP-N-acetyl-alpha-D-muramoyl-L-alanyl-L-glutamate epimerase